MSERTIGGRRQLRTRILAAAIFFVSAAGIGAIRTPAHAATIAAFSGSAAANGATIEGDFPGAPLSDQLVDLSGPTAQVAVNTIGASTGFAALPDPGDLILSVPGLASGLLSLGVAGLPPIHIGSLPSYPFSIATNAQNKADATEGAGPYALSSHSTPTSSAATASGGLIGVTGHTASLLSTASLESASDQVVATATSTLEGLTVGPLTLGKITSTATETRGSDGTITPTSEISITGAAIGGIAVSLTPKGLNAVGHPLSLPIAQTLSKLLNGAGITVKIEPAHIFKHRVVSPALVITMPVKVKLGTAYGTLTVTTASATASLVGSANGLGPLLPPTGTPPSTITPGGTIPGTSGITSPNSGAVPGLGSTGTTVGPGTSAIGPTVAGTPGTSNAGYDVALSDRFDIRSMYLLLALIVAIVIACAPVHRLLGARSRWTSGD